MESVRTSIKARFLIYHSDLHFSSDVLNSTILAITTIKALIINRIRYYGAFKS